MIPSRPRLRLNFWMTVCAVPALMVLVGLGVWQLQRLEWKEGLIAERAARLAQPPVPLEQVPAEGWRDFELRQVLVRGRFLHDRSMEIVNRSHGGRPGAHIVTPLAIDGGGTLLVDRGWAPPRKVRRPDEMQRPEGIVDVRGVLRAGGPTSAWVPDNEPAKGIWFYPDPAAMAAAAGLDESKPYIVEAAGTPAGQGYPIGGQTITQLRNSHLEYALTWFGLAAVLVGVYVAYHVRRQPGAGETDTDASA